MQANYATDTTYAHVNGKPVLYVYNADDADCSIADKWSRFFADWYVVLKVFPNATQCRNQPAGWHQYAPAVAADRQAGHSYAISPGFWRADEPNPRLARNLDRWKANIRDMVGGLRRTVAIDHHLQRVG